MPTGSTSSSSAQRKGLRFVRGGAPAFFSSSRLTLNITRGAIARLGWCPSGRLFEAAACGTPLVSAWFEELDAFLRPGEELLIARSTQDVLDALSLSDEKLLPGGRQSDGTERPKAVSEYLIEADDPRRREEDLHGHLVAVKTTD